MGPPPLQWVPLLSVESRVCHLSALLVTTMCVGALVGVLFVLFPFVLCGQSRSRSALELTDTLALLQDHRTHLLPMF